MALTGLVYCQGYALPRSKSRDLVYQFCKMATQCDAALLDQDCSEIVDVGMRGVGDH